MEIADKKFYLEELKSEECQCGRSKRARTTFCWLCYSKLPSDMKSALYKRIGCGYEEAREEAGKFLQDN